MKAVRWGPLVNVRDLGGLPVATGRTVPGRVYRSSHLDALDDSAWAAVHASGVRTLLDLRNIDEIGPSRRPPTIGRRHLPIEDQGDHEFMARWGDHLDSPAYYPTNVALWPEQLAAVFVALADAPPGGVVVHCASGRDRTGLVVAMMLQLAGVPTDAIVGDYLTSVEVMHVHAGLAQGGHEQLRDDEAHRTHVIAAERDLRAFLASFSTEQLLRERGYGAQASAVRDRLTVPTLQ